MALFQSDHALLRKHVPTPAQAGQVTAAIFDFTFSAAYANATDKVELGVLPAGARVIDAVAIAANLNGNITIGVMSGTVGVNDDTRTVGAELFSAVAMTSTVSRLAVAATFGLAASNVDRSIGLTGSADIAAAANKTIRLIVTYIL